MIWLLGALAAVAWGQSTPDPLDYTFDPERFRPHADVYGYSVTEGTSTLRHLQVAVGVWGNYSEDTLVLTDDGQRIYLGEEDIPSNDSDGVLDIRSNIDLQAGIGLGGFFSLTFDLPITLWQSGFELRHLSDPNTPRDILASGPGDLRISPKFVLADLDDYAVSVAVIPAFSLPTGLGRSFMGEGGFTATPLLAVEFSDNPVRKREHIIRGGFNVGALIRQPARYQSLLVSHEFIYRGALALAADKRVELGVEVVGSYGGSLSAHQTLEVLPWIKLIPIDLVTITAGAGLGIMPGVGSPDVRAFLGGTLQPSFNPKDLDRDKDGIHNKIDDCENIPEDFDGFEDEDGCPEDDNDKDGILDVNDECPNEPEDPDGFQDRDGCPDDDNDGDGIVDVADRCPNDPETVNGYQDDDGCPDKKPVLDTDRDGFRDDWDKCPYDPEDFDGFEDSDGCPELDNDGDGIFDVVDECPMKPEDFDGDEDEDGCPEENLDWDGDGILNDVDVCPNDPETFNDFEDGDGCPDTAPPKRVFVQKTHIVITEKIYFDTNRDTIKPVSFPLLDEIAGVLLDNPDLTLVRVEGHTDSDGTDAYNLDLSTRRAGSVVTYLVTAGVESVRLEAVGYGEARPIADNETDEGKAANRRVEFLIVERE